MSKLNKPNFYIHVYPTKDGTWEIRYSPLDTIDHGAGQVLNRNHLTEAEADEIAAYLKDDKSEIVKHDTPPRTVAEWLAGAPATH